MMYCAYEIFIVFYFVGFDCVKIFWERNGPEIFSQGKRVVMSVQIICLEDVKSVE